MSDATGYGRGDDQRHTAMQAGFVEVMEQAAEGAQLSREAWFTQPAGDGELALLPATEPEPPVVDDFVRELDAALRRRNRGLERDERLRLRLAIHYGVAYPAPNGLAGQGVVAVSRLLNWEPLRQVLAAADEASLALILSARVFEDTVQQGHTSHRPNAFRKVTVRNKEYSGDAWILTPGADVHRIELSAGPDAPAPPPHVEDAPRPEQPERERQPGPGRPAQPAVHNEFHQAVDAREAVFGIVHR
jgi:hypothetical protein